MGPIGFGTFAFFTNVRKYFASQACPIIIIWATIEHLYIANFMIGPYFHCFSHNSGKPPEVPE